MDCLVLKNLHKSFGENDVLRGVDLRVDVGESVVVIGGSGSGKSVMLRCVLGLTTPDQGQIELNGTDITHLRGSAAQIPRRHIGMLFQSGALFDSLRVWENVAFILLNLKGMNKTEARKVALEKLERVGLNHRTGDLYPIELSGGMQKRVALARAIADNPKLVLFDEPTTGLDPITAATIDDLIVSTCRDLGASVLSITHDMASARKIADRIAMLYQGKIIWEGRAADIDHSGSPYVEQFIHGHADGPIG